jgi:hypothetical protein
VSSYHRFSLYRDPVIALQFRDIDWELLLWRPNPDTSTGNPNGPVFTGLLEQVRISGMDISMEKLIEARSVMHASSEIADPGSAPDPGSSSSEKTEKQKMLAGEPYWAAPVRIGENVWIGGGAIICQGVTIGDNTTIGAGSVVVKGIPASMLAVGNPC